LIAVKVWSMTGGLVHTFRGHSRAVTNLVIHPKNSTIIMTCSLDGTIRMWSLDTMDAIYRSVKIIK
jgi:WD40 repeat protein